MDCRVEILGADQPNATDAADPETISGFSPLWARDMEHCRPWTRMRLPENGQTNADVAWASGPAADAPVILVCGRCPSTMDAAWWFIEAGRMRPWDSLMAVTQTAGRGQHQRQWISPAGNIHASWLWPLPESGGADAKWKNLISLVAGFIFAQTFRKFTLPVQIKWPNDLLICDRKFGGLLVEIRNDHILVGCGINLAFAPEDRLLRDQFAVPATHLSREGFDFTPLALWKALVTGGKSLFESLIVDVSPGELIKMIDARMAWVGKTVAVRGIHDEVAEAVILGLSPDGGLRVKQGPETRVLYSGSIIPA